MSTSVHRLLTQWWRLQPWEKRALFSLSWRLWASWLLLHIVDFRTVCRGLNRHRAKPTTRLTESGLTPLARWQRCVQLLAIAANYSFLKATCLQKSVALCSFLRANGLEAELKIGALKSESELKAHAWVVIGQTVLGDPGTRIYSEFPALVL
jgi:hypothetical protein